MKTITLFACAAAFGFAFAGTASASDVRVGVGVRIGSERDGISVRIGVNDRNDRRDNRHYDDRRWDRRDRHGNWDRYPRSYPPVVIAPPRCEPPVVIVPAPCPPPVIVIHEPIQVTITEVVGYREERYISGYTKDCQRVWDRRCREWKTIEVEVPVWSVRTVAVTATRVVTANWCHERLCYGYNDNNGVFVQVQR